MIKQIHKNMNKDPNKNSLLLMTYDSWPNDNDPILRYVKLLQVGTWPEGSEQLLTSAPGTSGVPCYTADPGDFAMASMAISQGNHLPVGK